MKLTILYVVCIAVLATTLYGFQASLRRSEADRLHFEESAIANCLANQKNTENFNAFVDRIVASFATSPVLTPEQRRQRAAFFAGAHQIVPECPPLPTKVKDKGGSH